MNKVDRKGNKRVFPVFAGVTAGENGKFPDKIGDTNGDTNSAGENSAGENSVGKEIAGGNIDGGNIDGGKIGKGRHSERNAMENAGGRVALGSITGFSGTSDATGPDLGNNRGRFGYMQYIHGFIGCVLLVLALIHIPFPEPLAWLPYSAAAVLALITMKSELSMAISRVLAIATAAMMFFLFALFFLVVPTLEADWYMTQYGWAAVCLILSAFLMIPILSDYSCRLKADCMEARAARRTAFFSVPNDVHPESR